MFRSYTGLDNIDYTLLSKSEFPSNSNNNHTGHPRLLDRHEDYNTGKIPWFKDISIPLSARPP